MKGATNHLTIGQKVRHYRRRRGLSQKVLAELAGRTVSWIEKIESGRAQLQTLPTIKLIANVLDIAPHELLPDDIVEVDSRTRGHSVPAIRQKVLSYSFVTPHLRASTARVMTIDELRSAVDSLWKSYQRGNLSTLIAGIDALLPRADATCQATQGSDRAAAQAQMAYLYQVTAAALTKVGEVDLACICADRGVQFAIQSGDSVALASLRRSIAHALIASGQEADALSVIDHAVDEAPKSRDRDAISVRGSLHLVGAMAASVLRDRAAATRHLKAANEAAQRLREDANEVWTAFGPTNVAIHEVAVSSALGDYQHAVQIADRLNIEGLPPERRARHRLEVARALHHVRRVDEAIELVLQAERESAELVRRHAITHALLHEWLTNSKVNVDHRLDRLASYAGVIAA